MNNTLIRVHENEVIIPLSYFSHVNELELLIENETAVVRPKNDPTKFHKNKRRAQMMEQTAVFDSQHRQLWRCYPEEYVAFWQGKLVDHDSDHRQIALRMNDRFPNQVVLIRQVTKHPPKPLRLGSPRLVR